MRGQDQLLRGPWDLMRCGGLVGTGRAAKAHGRTGLVRRVWGREIGRTYRAGTAPVLTGPPRCLLAGFA